VKARIVLDTFEGQANDAHRARLAPGQWQEDKGGDRFERGTWKRRRGYLHTDVAGVSNAITSIVGFEIPGGSFGVAFVASTSIYGATGVAQQTYSNADAGFGEGGFGEGGFGA